MHVRTYDTAGTARDSYVLRCTPVEDQIWLQSDFVLTPRELRLVVAEHDGKIPDEQAVFTLMYPQFMYLINMPLHEWVSLHDPSFLHHLRIDQVTTLDKEKFGYTPQCTVDVKLLRLNRSNLLAPLLYKAATNASKWRSLDYGWMLQNWDTEHFRTPEGYPLTLKEWLQYGADGDVLWQKDGCSGVTDGGIVPQVNPFVRLATLSPAIKHVDLRDHCVGRSFLLLGFVEDRDVPCVANWPARVCLMPLDGGTEGTLFHALEHFNSQALEYYINTHQVYKLANGSAYSARVQQIQADRMNGIAEVAVKDNQCEGGVRTNHVMAVVNGGLVDPSDGSFHAWPDRDSTLPQSSWLRDVTMFIPMTKKRRAPRKIRVSSNVRNANKRAVAATANTPNEGDFTKSTRRKRDGAYTKTTTRTNTTTTSHFQSTSYTTSSTTTTTTEEHIR